MSDEGAEPTSAPPPDLTTDLAPVDVDGVRAVAAGTALWAIALVALLPFANTLRDDGRLWWLGTCAAGVVLGLAGLAYVTRRRNSIRRERDLRSRSDI